MKIAEMCKIQYEGWTTGEMGEELHVLKAYLRDFADREPMQKRIFTDYRERVKYLEQQINNAGMGHTIDSREA